MKSNIIRQFQRNKHIYLIGCVLLIILSLFIIYGTKQPFVEGMYSSDVYVESGGKIAYFITLPNYEKVLVLNDKIYFKTSVGVTDPVLYKYDDDNTATVTTTPGTTPTTSILAVSNTYVGNPPTKTTSSVTYNIKSTTTKTFVNPITIYYAWDGSIAYDNGDSLIIDKKTYQRDTTSSSSYTYSTSNERINATYVTDKFKIKNIFLRKTTLTSGKAEVNPVPIIYRLYNPNEFATNTLEPFSSYHIIITSSVYFANNGTSAYIINLPIGKKIVVVNNNIYKETTTLNVYQSLTDINHKATIDPVKSTITLKLTASDTGSEYTMETKANYYTHIIKYYAPGGTGIVAYLITLPNGQTVVYVDNNIYLETRDDSNEYQYDSNKASVATYDSVSSIILTKSGSLPITYSLNAVENSGTFIPPPGGDTPLTLYYARDFTSAYFAKLPDGRNAININNDIYVETSTNSKVYMNGSNKATIAEENGVNVIVLTRSSDNSIIIYKPQKPINPPPPPIGGLDVPYESPYSLGQSEYNAQIIYVPSPPPYTPGGYSNDQSYHQGNNNNVINYYYASDGSSAYFAKLHDKRNAVYINGVIYIETYAGSNVYKYGSNTANIIKENGIIFIKLKRSADNYTITYSPSKPISNPPGYSHSGSSSHSGYNDQRSYNGYDNIVRRTIYYAGDGKRAYFTKLRNGKNAINIDGTIYIETYSGSNVYKYGRNTANIIKEDGVIVIKLKRTADNYTITYRPRRSKSSDPVYRRNKPPRRRHYWDNDKPMIDDTTNNNDLYILKSQVIPPVCPVCPPQIVKDIGLERSPYYGQSCSGDHLNVGKYPDYSSPDIRKYLPIPVLNSFSSFGL